MLDFEKQIVELEKRIEDIKSLSSEHPEFIEEVKNLEQKREKLIKKVFSKLSAWDRVQLARHPKRPHSIDLIPRVFDDFFELHGDRNYGDDPALIAGLARINEKRLVLVAQEKGRDTNERTQRNFGMPHPEGYRKALRVFKLSEKFNLPIVCFVDTPGAYPGVGAEERGQAWAIAFNIFEMLMLPVPIIIFIIGEGGSGGALAIAVGNRVYALENSIYSVISPEGCASILWRDSKKADHSASALKLTPDFLLEFGIVDEIIPEPLGGAHRDWDGTAKNIKEIIKRDINHLSKETPEKLLKTRRERFNKIGVYKEE